MKKEDKSLVTQHMDKRLILRLRIYTIVMIIMLIIISYEVLQGTFSILMAIGGIIICMAVGTIVSRVYSLSWDEKTSDVIGRIDGIGAVILVCYLIFIFTRARYLGYWVQGAPLFAFIFSITAGTMLTRVMSTRHGINKILRAVNILG
jgi:hypothetical protein